MAFVSKSLICALTQDIRDIKNINETINLKLGKLDLKSWVCPLKQHDMIHEENTPREERGEKAYLLCLELLVDRLYIFFNIIRIFIEKLSGEIVEQETNNKLITQPVNFSLGVTVNILWNNLLQIETEMKGKTKVGSFMSNNSKQKLTVATQTEEVGLSSCDSCEISKQCIKMLSTAIMSALKYSQVEKTREELQSRIYDFTQFGFMNKIVEAVTVDMKKLINENQYLECNNRQYLLEKEQQAKEIETHIKKIAGLEDAIKQFEKDKLEERTKYEELELQLLDINQHMEKELINIKQKLENTNSENKDLKMELEKKKNYDEILGKNKNLQLENDNLKNCVKQLEEAVQLKVEHIHNLEIKGITQENTISTLSQDLKSLSTEVDNWKNRYVNLKGVNMSDNKKFTEKINLLQRSIQTLESNHKIVKQETAKVHEIYDANLNHFQEIFDMFESVQSKMTSFSKSSKLLFKNPLIMEDATVKGDPLADMKHQFDVNTNNIKKLYDRNELLLKTINRLEKLQEVALGRN